MEDLQGCGGFAYFLGIGNLDKNDYRSCNRKVVASKVNVGMDCFGRVGRSRSGYPVMRIALSPFDEHLSRVDKKQKWGNGEPVCSASDGGSLHVH